MRATDFRITKLILPSWTWARFCIVGQGVRPSSGLGDDHVAWLLGFLLLRIEPEVGAVLENGRSETTV